MEPGDAQSKCKKRPYRGNCRAKDIFDFGLVDMKNRFACYVNNIFGRNFTFFTGFIGLFLGITLLLIANRLDQNKLIDRMSFIWINLAKSAVLIIILLAFFNLFKPIASFYTRVFKPVFQKFKIGALQFYSLIYLPISMCLFCISAGTKALVNLSLGVWICGSLTAMGLLIASIEAKEVETGSEEDDKQRTPAFSFSKADIGIAFFLFIVAFALRGIGLNERPAIIQVDEAINGLWSRSINDILLFNNPFVYGYYGYSSATHFVYALAMKIFGNTYEGLRMPSAVIGAATVSAVYWTSRVLFSRRIGLMSSGFAIANHGLIHFSRVGVHFIFDSLSTTMSIGLLYIGLKEKSRFFSALAGLTLGIGLYFYAPIRTVALAMTCCYALVVGLRLIKTRSFFRAGISGFVFFVIGLLVMIFPFVITMLSNPSIMLNSTVAQASAFSRLMAEAKGDTLIFLRLVSERVLNALLGIVLLPVEGWYQPMRPIMLGIGAFSSILGFIAIFLTRKWLQMVLLVLAVGFSCLQNGITITPLAIQRYSGAMPLIMIFAGLGIASLFQFFRNFLGSISIKNWAMLLNAVMVIMLLIDIGMNIKWYFADLKQVDFVAPTSLNISDVGTQLGLALNQFPEDTPVYTALLPYQNPQGTMGQMGYLSSQKSFMNLPSKDTPIPKDLTRGVFVFTGDRKLEANNLIKIYPSGKLVEVVSKYQKDSPFLFSIFAIGDKEKEVAAQLK